MSERSSTHIRVRKDTYEKLDSMGDDDDTFDDKINALLGDA